MADITRRSFVKNSTVGICSLSLGGTTLKELTSFQNSDQLDIHIFSKHLQFLNYTDTGDIAAEMGFDGVDLTVRPNGHVFPENVIELLPQAIAELNNGGSTCKLITTSIESVMNPEDLDIIKTASKNGIEYYRTHWFKYSKDKSMKQSIELYQNEIKKLGELNEEFNIVGCYQNHAGTHIGASYWEMQQLMETVNPKYFGAQYDIRHAVAEGGHSWVNGFQLLKQHIKVIVLKDFRWESVNGVWKAVNVPIGEGMVDFSNYFRLLKQNNISVPVSLHFEYPLGGAEKGLNKIEVEPKVVFDAMVRDLTAIRRLWREA